MPAGTGKRGFAPGRCSGHPSPLRVPFEKGTLPDGNPPKLYLQGAALHPPSPGGKPPNKGLFGGCAQGFPCRCIKGQGATPWPLLILAGRPAPVPGPPLDSAPAPSEANPAPPEAGRGSRGPGQSGPPEFVLPRTSGGRSEGYTGGDGGGAAAAAPPSAEPGDPGEPGSQAGRRPGWRFSARAENTTRCFTSWQARAEIRAQHFRCRGEREGERLAYGGPPDPHRYRVNKSESYKKRDNYAIFRDFGCIDFG